MLPTCLHRYKFARNLTFLSVLERSTFDGLVGLKLIEPLFVDLLFVHSRSKDAHHYLFEVLRKIFEPVLIELLQSRQLLFTVSCRLVLDHVGLLHLSLDQDFDSVIDRMLRLLFRFHFNNYNKTWLIQTATPSVGEFN